MLSNKRITIIGNSVVDDAEIAAFGAVLNMDTFELSMTSRHIDKAACKDNRDAVRADQAEFEDFAYAIQDALKSATD